MKKQKAKKINHVIREQGITLIALVITIIVLLILAGVAISTLTGNNGLLEKTQYAAEQMEVAKFKDEAGLAYLELYSQNAMDQNYEVTLDELISLLQEDYGYSIAQTGGNVTGIKVYQKGREVNATNAVKVEKSTEENITVVLQGANKYVELNGMYYPISLSGSEIIVGEGENLTPSNSNLTVTGASKVTATVTGLTINLTGGATTGDDTLTITYGDKNATVKATVTEPGAGVGGGSEPEIGSTATFGDANPDYKDYFGKLVTGYNPSSGSNWRLFYADTNYRLNNTSIVTGFGTSRIGTLAQNFNKKYTTTGNWELKTDETNLNFNIKAVAALMDTGEWTDYKEEGIAEWATGAPTLEMFIKSYNATHSSLTLYSNVASNTSTGYKVSTDNSSWSTYISGLGNSTELDRSIYCKRNFRYWLATPSAYDDKSLVTVHGDGALSITDYSQISANIRPLVSIPISKIGLSSENKILTITNNF